MEEEKKKIVAFLRERAGKKECLVSYSEVADVIGLKLTGDHTVHNILGKLLDEINKDEVLEGRPMLTAIVVSKATKQVGQGFFICAKQLNVWDGKGDRQLFWASEVGRVNRLHAGE